MTLLPIVCSANVTNGTNLVEVTGVDASTGLAVVLTDINCRPNATVFLDGVGYLVAARVDTTHFQIERNYAGATLPGVACSIAPFTPEMANRAELATSLRTFSARDALMKARGNGLHYVSLGATGAADPGPGKVSYVGASWAAATALCIDVLDAAGRNRAGLVDRWAQGDTITVESIATSAYVSYELTQPPTNEGPGAWRKLLEFAVVASDGAIVDSEDVRLVRVPAGTPGPGYTTDAEVADMAGRAAHDAAAVGFTVLVQDVGGADAGRAAIYRRVGAAGNWVLVQFYTGPKGDQGDKGWAPQLVSVADGARQVLRLVGYVGGAGAAPTANVGDYLKADGTFTANLAEAADMRGPAGVSFIWRGPYAGGAAYAKDHVALDQGAAWIALQATMGNAPPTRPTTANAYWELMVDKGADGLGTGDVVGPAGATTDRVAVFDGATGKLLKDGGKTIAELVPAGYDDLLISVSLLALQVADNSNVALFLGSSGNRIADSFDSLTYVDVAGATNLDTSAAGILKPSEASAVTMASVGLDGNTGDFTGYNFRWVVAAAAFSVSGSKVRFLLRGPTSGTTNVTALTFNHQAASGDAYDMIGTPGAITMSGSSSFSLAANAYTWSDWVTFAFDKTKALVIAGYFGASGVHRRKDGLGANYNRHTKSGSNETATANVTGYDSAEQMGLIDQIDVSTGSANNLTVRSASFTAASTPTKMKALLRVKEVDAAVAGTDYTMECSRDGGTTWSTMTLTELFTSPSPTAGIRVVEAAETDVSGQPSGTSPRWRFKTLNNKNVELHDVYLYWS